MKKSFYNLLWLGFLFFSLGVNAQNTQPIINSKLNGQIVDAKTKYPLPGVAIQIKGTTHGVVTDFDGKFYFQTGQKFPYTLLISFIGYKSKEVIAESNYINIELDEDVKQLNDLVVVGYGTQRKKDITGAVASIPVDNLHQITPSVDNLLRGSIPGIVVTQSSGQPGATASIRIRGGNSITGGNEPLYVIDGILVYNDNNNGSAGVALAGGGANVLASINPSDIESIEVLKDASATAIYGSRGANGVIIITTKKGQRGHNTVSYQTYFGTQQVSRTLPLLNAYQWATLRNAIQTGIGQTPSFSETQLEAFKTAGTYDWQSAIFKKAPIQNHQVSFSGGDDNSRYAISGNYYDQVGVVLGSDFKRYSFRLNYDRNINDAFKVGVNSMVSSSLLKGVSNNGGGSSTNAPNTIVSTLFLAPVVPIYNADGSFNITQNPYLASVNGYVTNPVADLINTTNQTKLNRVLSSLYGEYKILEGLTAKITLNGDVINTKQNYYAPSTTTNGFSTKGLASIGSKLVTSILNENTLNYSKYINANHQFSILAGYTFQNTRGEYVNAGATNFINDNNKYNSLGDGVAVKPVSDAFESVLKSWLARINYSLLGRYNFTLSGRADGSSRFGSASRWGYFPSAGFSWNISEEEFGKRLPAISDFKLRLSVGSTGNQEIADYLSLASLGTVNYALGGTIFTGFAPSRLSNPNLKWEKTRQYNTGIDIRILKRVNIVFDAYYKKTTDLLVNVPVPLSSGYTSVLQNIGSVENKGLELGITTDNLHSSSLIWKTNLVIATNRNKVLEIGNGVPSFFPLVPNGVLVQQQPSIVKVGLPLGTFWGYKTAGIFQSQEEINASATLNGAANTKPGDRKYQDISGPNGVPDGKITADYDKVNLGSAQPKYTFSLGNSLSYKGFDLAIFFQGVQGNSIFNTVKQQLEIPSVGNNASIALANFWTTANPNNEIPRAANAPAATVNDRFVEDGSFLRLKTLTFGYTLPKGITSKVKIGQVKIYATAQNLLTWTKYTGYDPEVSSYEQNNLYPGIDYGAYPNAKSFIAGINIVF